jgi:hypothetical protein
MKAGDLVSFNHSPNVWWGGSETYNGRIGIVIKQHGYISPDRRTVASLWIVHWFDLGETRFVNEKNLMVLA